MRRKGNRVRNQRGVLAVEVAVLFVCVIGALILLAPYVKRAAEGGVKSNADSIGSQWAATQTHSSMSKSYSYNDGAGSVSHSCSDTVQQLEGGTSAGESDCDMQGPTGYDLESNLGGLTWD